MSRNVWEEPTMFGGASAGFERRWGDVFASAAPKASVGFGTAVSAEGGDAGVTAPAGTPPDAAHPAQFQNLSPSPSGGSLPVNVAPLMEVDLKLSVILGETRMSLGDLLNLEAGSVVELSTAAGDPIDILVNEKLYAKGEVVVVGDAFGVKIIEIVHRPRPAVS